ncbi:unnamed protein product [Phytomonas sp. EM1]|nr:unnamed protein product [Phytomonas sp. EM1]|eukprot:CCW63690.1 unnamed protein product [Phytomonas sp. isolate EM1]
MQKVVRDRTRDCESYLLPLLRGKDSVAESHINEFGYSVPVRQLNECAKPVGNTADKLTSLSTFQPEGDTGIHGCDSFSISGIHCFRGKCTNIGKHDLNCEAKTNATIPPEDLEPIKESPVLEYSLPLIPEFEYMICTLCESSSNDKRSNSSNSETSQMSDSCSHASLRKDDAFNFGIDTYFHGTQLGFGRQTSYRRVSPVISNFLSSYSPIKSLCSTYQQVSDGARSDTDTIDDRKLLKKNDEETMQDLFRLDSLFQFPGKPFPETMKGFADILHDGEALSQACVPYSIRQESSIHPRNDAVREEILCSHSSSTLLSGQVPPKSRSGSAVKVCKFDLPESKLTKDEIDMATECIIGEIDSNSTSSHLPSTSGKTAPFVPLMTCSSTASKKQLDNEVGRISQMCKAVNQPVDKLTIIKHDPLAAPATVVHRHRPSVHFTSSIRDASLGRNEASAKFYKPLHGLKHTSMASQKHKYSFHSLLSSSHASESSSCSTHTRAKSTSHILSDIKSFKPPEDTHKVDPPEHKMPGMLPVLRAPQIKAADSKSNLQRPKSNPTELLPIRGNTDELPYPLPRSSLSKAKMQKYHPGHSEVCNKSCSEDGIVLVSFTGRNRESEGLKASSRVLKSSPEAVGISKNPFEKRNAGTVSSTSNEKDASFHHTVVSTSPEGTSLSHGDQKSFQFMPRLIASTEGSDACTSQKGWSPEKSPTDHAFEMDTLRTDRQRLNILSDLKPSVTDMVPVSSKKFGKQGAQLCNKAISQRSQHAVGRSKVSLPGVNITKQDMTHTMSSIEKAQRSRFHSSFSASGEELPSSSSMALISFSGALDSTSQEPSHQSTMRLWMNQFKSSRYCWHTPSKYHSSDADNAVYLTQDAKPFSRSLPLKISVKSEVERTRERKERVAALLACREKKRQEKFQKLQLRAEEQKDNQAEPFFLPSQNVSRAHEVLAPPQGGLAQVLVAAPHPLAEKTTSTATNKHVAATSNFEQNNTRVRSMVVLSMHRTNHSGPNVQHDSGSNDDQIGKKFEKRPNSAANVRIFLKDRHTLKVCSPFEQPKFFRIDEIVENTGKVEHLQSSCISEAIEKLYAGINVAVLLSSTKRAKTSSLALVQHIFGSLLERIPAKAVLSWSMCTMHNGRMNHLNLTGANTNNHPSLKSSVKKDPLSGIALHTTVLKGMLLEGATWTRVSDVSQLSVKLSNAYQQVELHKMGDLSMLVISLVLRQVINDKGSTRFSSLLVTDSGINCEILDDTLRSSDSGPYGLLQNIISRCNFTVTAFLVGDSESSHALRLLNAQRRLCNIENIDLRMESAKCALKQSKEELTSVENKNAYTNAAIAATEPPIHPNKIKEPHHLASACDILSRSCSTMTLENAKLKKKTNATNTADDLHCSEDSIKKNNLALKPTGVTVPNQGHNSGEADPLVSRALYCHNAKIGTSSLSGRHDTSAISKNYGGDCRFLPGATSIGPNGGPVWSNLAGNTALDPRFPTSGVEVSTACETRAESIISKYDDRSSCQSGSKDTKSRHKLPLFQESTNAARSAPTSTNVRTLVILDSQCGELSNITYDDNVVFVTTEDDFEDYEMDEVIEMPLEQDGKYIQSKILEELCETICRGCNAALLCGVSRAFRVSPLALSSVVNSIFGKFNNDGIGTGNSGMRGGLTVSIVDIKGEMVVDLLEPNAEPRKLVVAISPIFGSCVHGVRYQPVKDSHGFDEILSSALAQLSFPTHAKDHRLVFCSLIFKFKHQDQNDVLVCSLVASLAQQNVGLYRSVLECSPLVPRALFHYALRGPCFTVALLGIGGDEKRVKKMLDINRYLRGIKNRPTHPGSILQFVSSVREGLVPTLSEKLKQALSEEERTATTKVLSRVEEMISDAEALLKDFDHQQPKAYVHEDASEHKTTTADISNHRTSTKTQCNLDLSHRQSIDSKVGSTTSRHQQLIRFPKRYSGQVYPPIYSSKFIKETKESHDESRIKSLVCFDKRLLGGGLVAVEGNSVLVTTKKGACRFDADEVIVRDGNDQPIPNSELISQIVQKFVSGCDTGLLAADSENCAFTLLILHKIVCDVLNDIDEQKSKGGSRPLPTSRCAAPRGSSRTVKGELQVCMSLIKDKIATDLLCDKTKTPSHIFKMEHSAIFSSLIKGITMHSVNTLEEFDQFFSLAIDNADPALQTEDPGVMVISLFLTKYVSELDKDDVFVSTFTSTAVFDAVHYYTSVLEDTAGELLELFRKLIGGISHTVALVGISDEDNDTHKFLTVLDMLSRVVNLSSEPKSINKLVQDIQLNISRLMEHSSASTNSEDGDHIMKWIQTLELALHDVKEFVQSRWPQSRLPAFVPPV